jgi:uracil-DNA glycosylase
VNNLGTFPFGQPLRKVIQTDRTPKKIFVLGVYASAVHARWINPKKKTVVNALAVASEPYIFWRGDRVESILHEIKIPEEFGELVPPDKQFNGPSGLALDDLILHPLGLDRDQAWLCDLVPHSCVNPNQQQAINREYMPLFEKFDLPYPSIPLKPRRLTDETRRNQILEEIITSQANYLILLGDEPIQWFLEFYDNRWKNLAGFGITEELYGHLHGTKIGNKQINILPLTHPRQIAKLGNYSKTWYQAHQTWLIKRSSQIANFMNASQHSL